MSQFAAQLADEYGDRLDKEGRRLVMGVVDGAERAQMLVADLLEYAKVANDPFERTWIDCNQILAETLELLSESIGEKDASVTSDALPTIEAHPVQFRQLLQNLLSNALKFSGEADLRVHVSGEREGRAWHFTVTDNGIGIDPIQSERVFELFRRLNPRDMQAGTGMGLSICKKVVERHGGRIWVEPRAPQGTTFHFTIPEREVGFIAVLNERG
jgi:signal transduction histidine kinase